MKQVLKLNILFGCTLLAGCQVPTLSPVQPGEAFSTQALTPPYLTRKVNRWLSSSNKPAMSREMKFGCYKHPITLQQIFSATPALHTQITQLMPTEISQDPALENCLNQVSPLPPPSGEIAVNTFTADDQEYPVVAMDGAGNFVIAWTSENQIAGSNLDIYAQRFNSAGVPQGPEFLVNTWTTGTQGSNSDIAIAMNAAGNFVISWAGQGSASELSGIYAQRYDSAGQPQGGQISVNSWTTNSQLTPDVAIDSAGNFVVTWYSPNQTGGSGSDIYAQRFNSAGQLMGNEFRVNTHTPESQSVPAIAMNPDGNFVISWASMNQVNATSSSDIYAQRYNSEGQPQGNEFRVNTNFSNGQYTTDVGMDPAGNFVISWYGHITGNSESDIFAQRYNSNGVPQDGEFRVNTLSLHSQNAPAITVDQAGNFVIAWQSNTQAGTYNGADIYVKRFNHLGEVQGSEMRVNTYTTSHQIVPTIAGNLTGTFVVTWHSFNQASASSGWDIYAQRYTNTGVPQ